MFKKILAITTLLVIVLSFSGCFLTESSSPEKPFGFWIGVRDGFFFGLRLIIKIFTPVDVFADHRTGAYTVGFLLFAIPQALELGIGVIGLTGSLLTGVVGRN